jgi:vacuolar-type H+-ATPase subunit F/Vma7
MATDEIPDIEARLIAMGGAALMQGFALIGFETWPDADEHTVERVLTDVLRKRQRALVLLEPHLARCDCAALRVVLTEGGRIVVSEIPPLEKPQDYRPVVDDLLATAVQTS